MVMEKAAELAEALVQSDEFLAYNAAREAVENDETASQLMRRYSDAEERLQLALSDPADLTAIEGIKQDLEELRMLIVDNAMLERLAETQGGFQFLMSKVNDVIGQRINPRRAESCDCAGGCDSCEGCH